MPDRPGWLLASKPLTIRDSTTALVRSIVAGLPPELPLAYLGDPAAPVRPASADDVIPATAVGYAPGVRARVTMLKAIALDRSRAHLPLHFFPPPNRFTSPVVALLRRLQPHRRIVQSIASSRHAARYAGLLRGLDAVVTGSDHARAALCRAGVQADRVARIYPGVELGPEPPAHPRQRRLLYAGGLDAGVVDRLVAVASLLHRPELHAWTLTIAVDQAGERHAARAALTEALRQDVVRGRVELTTDADATSLLDTTALQLWLGASTGADAELPPACLEGLARGVGLVALDAAPVDEIFTVAKRHDLRPGWTAPRNDLRRLLVPLAEAMADPSCLAGLYADARSLARREFSMSVMVDQYARLYEGLDASERVG